MEFPIIDLHCDLLAYLAENDKNMPQDYASNCSLPQLRAGGVYLQVLAIFTETKKGSAEHGQKQLKCLEQIQGIKYRLAIENASSFFNEDEPFEVGIKRLESLANPLYISLTWNDENRFGGGNSTSIGLKSDGEKLLYWMSGKNIAVDFSHTSDPLAHDILNYIDKHSLKIIPIASHSNYRPICDHPRNLSDEFAKAIFERKGIIGLNFVRHFVGSNVHDFLKHIEHALSLGGEDHIAFGADFFGGIILPTLEHLIPFFFKEFSDSSSYPRFIDFLLCKFPSPLVEKISHKNALSFITKPENPP